MTREDLRKIEKEIGYSFRNLYLLQQAFVRKSFTNENKNVENNEVLEFIGDKSLDLAVIKVLMNYYGNLAEVEYLKSEFKTQNTEFDFTEIKKKLVEKKMLASRIDLLEFNKYLIMGNSDIINNVQNDMSVKEDLFEAIIGAVTLDCRYNMDVIENVVIKMLDPEYYLDNGFPEESENYIGKIQEWYQKEYNKLPVYTSTQTYNGFQSALFIPGIPPFIGNGRTIALANMEAAKKAFKYIEARNLRKTILDELGEFTLDRAINQLQELYQKRRIPEPFYHFHSQPNYEDGGTNWECICRVTKKDAACATGNSKSEAKKAAALEMLNHIFYSGKYSGEEE